MMKVTLGPQKKSRVITEQEKFNTAVHESGHAIIHKLAKEPTPVQEVSIIPRGGAGGYTLSADDDKLYYYKETLYSKIQSLLGGICAEKLINGDTSTGASSDLKRATSIAKRMVTEWGMSEKVGPISYASDKEIFIGRDMASHVTYSEQVAAIIDEEVRLIIDSILQKARELLKKNKNLLDNMARLLVERETIFSEEVDMLMEGKSVEEIMAFMDENERTLKENPFNRGKKKASKPVDIDKSAEKVEQAQSTIEKPSTEADSNDKQVENKEDVGAEDNSTQSENKQN